MEAILTLKFNVNETKAQALLDLLQDSDCVAVEAEGSSANAPETNGGADAPTPATAKEPQPAKPAPPMAEREGKEYSDTDLRDALFAAERRIMGDASFERKDEAYMKWHPLVLAHVRKQIEFFAGKGHTRMSQVPQNRRREFVDELNGLYIDACGNIDIKPPF